MELLSLNSSIHLFLIFIIVKLLQIAKMEVSKAQTNNTVVGSYYTLYRYLKVNCISENKGKWNFDFFPFSIRYRKTKVAFSLFPVFSQNRNFFFTEQLPAEKCLFKLFYSVTERLKNA